MTEDREQAYPRLETDRVILRALRMEDAGFILREWGSPTVTQYMRDEAPLKTREEAEEWLRPLQTPEKMPTFKWWGIESKADKVLIGTCGYSRWNKQHHWTEIGYDLWPDYWGGRIDARSVAILAAVWFRGDGAESDRGDNAYGE